MTVRGLEMKDLPLTPPDFFTPFARRRRFRPDFIDKWRARVDVL